ncbi:glycosyltransferase family 2 protein [Risungbinella massiliensis]|uniref:glycosyltransferase family 2 protein n=1 Tax=Risungbinella massiliensis TaxID=1329796 RepID=UPI000AD5F888|nr:glycosyltransferase family 2 protein [Risungbinella massiliensis]
MISFKQLSLCMIVKDEEETLASCLESVKYIVDEIILVDTGSTDRTKEIAQNYGANIYDFPWTDDFSAARNYGIQKAQGDWILWLDADEKVEVKDAAMLRDILYCSNYDLLAVNLINFIGEKEDKSHFYQIAHHRLFRNHMGFCFENRIHETLNITNVLSETDQKKRVGIVPIRVYHTGYLQTSVEKKGKFERNLTLLKRELGEKEHSPWIHYHIASEYYRVQEYAKAFQHVNQSIRDFLTAKSTPPALLYKLKYSIMLSLGSIEGAWPSIRLAVSLYPDYVDLHFYMGYILLARGEYKEALASFQKCLEIGEGNLEYLCLYGLGSYQAMYYCGLCHQKLGEPSEAIKCFLQTVVVSPNFQDARKALRICLKNQGFTLDSFLDQYYSNEDAQKYQKLISDTDKNKS